MYNVHPCIILSTFTMHKVAYLKTNIPFQYYEKNNKKIYNNKIENYNNDATQPKFFLIHNKIVHTQASHSQSSL